MNLKKSTIIVLSLLLFLTVRTQAEITIFESNSIISDGDTYDTVVVKGDGTVLEMTGGSVNRLITMNRSTCNISGGNIENRLISYPEF